MTRHPTTRAERLKVNRKKRIVKEKETSTPKVWRKLKEHVKDEETTNELREYS